MGTVSFAVLVIVGLVIAITPHVLSSRRGGKRSLTTWILSMMGVGILVGSCFRNFSIETFSPQPARADGSIAGPFQVPAGSSFTADVGDGAVTVVISDKAATMSAAEVVVAINHTKVVGANGESTALGIRAYHEADRVSVTSTAKGDTAELSLGGGGGLGLLGLSPETRTGVGSAQSTVRDLHQFLRDIFINALMMMIVPVIFTSIIAGMLSLGSSGLGRLGGKTLLYYMTTSLLAIVVGLIIVNLVAPGDGAVITLEDKPSGFEETANQSTSDFLFNFFRNLIPTNPIKAMVDGKILQLIFFALFIGYFINRLPSEDMRRTLSTFFNGLFEVMLLMVRTLLWLAPAGVYAIFVKIIAETGPEVFIDLGWYALCVFIGLAIHAGITLPLMLRLIGRVNPWRHFQAMSPALLTAFSTSSSSATLPMTLRCVEQRAGVSNRTSSFVLPLGATVNMDGTALYECIAAIFIAQIYITQGEMPPLEFQQQVLVVFTALAASIGAAGVPMAGMVMLGIILNALGMPLEGVGYVLAVDRILDMCRTTVNVWSDSCGCAIIARTEGEDGVLQTWPPKSLT
ncbi:MAG: dicarboxylate/amino acid:cation symporter [Planctomycetota bacterium]|nr:dicarboxylate/amino acid:cation symporter [Planctomycetota bacterium]